MEQRRTQRYQLQLPLRILQLGDQRVNRNEETRDISSGGVSFMTRNHVDVGGRIEYIITLSGKNGSGNGSANNPPVRIRCLGKVLRAKQADMESHFEVAVTMERYQFLRPEEVEAIAVCA